MASSPTTQPTDEPASAVWSGVSPTVVAARRNSAGMTFGPSGGPRPRPEPAPRVPPARRPRQPLVLLCGAVAAGIVGDRYASAGWWAWVLLASAGLVLWGVFRWRRCSRLAVAVLLVAVAATAAGWHHLQWRMFAADDLGLFAGFDAAPVCVEAVVTSTPHWRPAPPPNPLRTLPADARTELRLRVCRVRDGPAWRAVSGNVYLAVDGRLTGVRAGDTVRVFGILRAPEPPRNPGEYDFAALARARRQLCQLRATDPACVAVVRPGASIGGGAWLRAARSAGNALLARYVRGPNAGLAAAVLLGMREQVDRDRAEEFFVTGTVHLLAISGLHVGILATGFWFAAGFSPLPRRATLVLAMVLIVTYALLTEARPPVVRAAVLVVAACSARLLGRAPLSFNTLSLAGLIVLAANPTQLFQTGAQLSFLAVAALILFGRPPPSPKVDPLEQLIRQQRPWVLRGAFAVAHVGWQVFVASAAIWLVSLPLVVYRFHLVTPVALVLNPVVWLPMAAALFAGMGVLLFGWIAPPVASVCGWCCDLNLSLIEWFVGRGLQVPGNHFWTAAPPWWWVAGFYAGLALWAALPPPSRARRRLCALAAAWIALGVLLVLLSNVTRRMTRDEPLRLTFVAVGHGCSVLVELPCGRTLLYDAGRLGDPAPGVDAVSAVLWSRGITALDAVIISHADADHYNVVPGLLERFPVGEIYVSPMMFAQPSEALDTLRAAIDAAGVRVLELQAGDRFAAPCGTILEVLHPRRDETSGSDNADSIVAQLSYAGRTVLLPGDLEGEGMHRLLSGGPRHYDLIMAPHHGSIHSHPRQFLDWSTPAWIVISGGRSADALDGWAEYQTGNAMTQHTGYQGAVTAAVDRDGIAVHHWGSRQCARRTGWRPVVVPAEVDEFRTSPSPRSAGPVGESLRDSQVPVSERPGYRRKRSDDGLSAKMPSRGSTASSARRSDGFASTCKRSATRSSSSSASQKLKSKKASVST